MSWSRRSNSHTPTPPRAFMGHNESAVKSAIRNMAAEQRWMAVRDITVEDLRQLFIPAEWRHSLQEAFHVAAPGWGDQELRVEMPTTDPAYHLVGMQKLEATFKWSFDSCPHGFFVPRGNIVELQPDISDALRQKWGYVVDNLGRISWEFGLVMKVFETLNQNGLCNTPQQMRYVWPAIRHIVDKAKISGLNLVEASARAGDRARVPAEVRDFLVPTVNIVNRTLLIDNIDMADRECRLTVNAPEYVIEEQDGPNWKRLVFTGVN